MKKRLIVTGREGQVVRCLVERGAKSPDFEVIALGRPDLDLSRSGTISSALTVARPDIIVSAAAYTAVDQAESEPELAWRINTVAAAEIAATAAQLGIPIIHLSTDYVFDGSKGSPYVETDAVAPLGVYGRTKLAGEAAVAAAADNHVILRTAWVYSPYGKNFAKTMLRLAETRDSVSVVDDQIGNPTSALDIADGIIAVARNLFRDADSALRGTFHMTGNGQASWAAFAAEIFKVSQRQRSVFAAVVPIGSDAYPTPTRRPANSRLDCGKLERLHGVRMPPWQASTEVAISKLVSK